MPLTLTDIIAEADLLVPNAFSPVTKVAWLNEINTEFFEVVKIPNYVLFNTVAATASYTLTGMIRGKNIARVQVGTTLYPSFLYEGVSPGTNYHLFNDASLSITLESIPTSVLKGSVKYFSTATTTFVSSTLTANPDAPTEYHWIYILGLCAKIAKAIPDITLANNYTADYNANLLIAQQNYAQRQ